MVIIVTGEIGVGKTTVCKKTIDMLRTEDYLCAGILTPKVLVNDEIASIDIIDISTGQKETLAKVDGDNDNLRIGKYFFDHDGIAFGLEAISKGLLSDLMVVDELGHLELRGQGFAQAIKMIRASEVKNSISVVRSELLQIIKPLLGKEVILFTVSSENRDSLPAEICSILT